MPCDRVDLGDGATAIVCSRGGPRCKCGNRSTRLCDFPLSGAKVGKTCDAKLCERCAVRVGPNKDYCRAHADVAAKGTGG